MALDLARLVDPVHTALVTSECQRGVMGDLSQLPELAKAAEPVVPQIARLVESGRQAGVHIIHCMALRRPDGGGANANARIFQAMARAGLKLLPGSEAAELVPQIRVESTDWLMSRYHGLSPFQGTELDFVLRNLGVRTLVATGVSVNVAIQNLCYDAVNASYQVVVPRDAVAGFPAEYAELVFAHSLGAVATLVKSADLVGVWSA